MLSSEENEAARNPCRANSPQSLERTRRRGQFLRRRTGRDALGTICYIHGLGESGLCFEELMLARELARWDHLAADLSGYGKSDWSSPPSSLRQHAQRLLYLLSDLSCEPVVIVGHSMGGVIGQILCETAPEWVRAFLNVEGNLTLSDCQFSRKAAARDLKGFLEGGIHDILDPVYRAGREDPALRRYHASLWMCDPRSFYLNSCELVVESSQGNLAGRFAALSVPRLYVGGLAGGLGDDSQKALERAGAPWEGVSHAGHWPFLQSPREFVDIAERFLETLT